MSFPATPAQLRSWLGRLFAPCHQRLPPCLSPDYDWKPVRIGAGGFVTGLCVHPLDATVRYARTTPKRFLRLKITQP